MNIAIITGASSGMGMECVKQLHNYFGNIDEIWVVARRYTRLKELHNMTQTKVRTFDLDLSKKEDLSKFAHALKADRPTVRVLVNGAGYGKIGMFEDISYEDNLGMVDVNCRALTAVTYMSLPYMKRNSRIIQFASMASYLPQAGFSIYAATKAFVLSFSQSLRVELEKKGIVVTAVCPGPVSTEFFDIAEEHGKQPVFKKIFMAKPEKVVEKALRDSLRKKETSVYGVHYKMGIALLRILPTSTAIRLVNCMR